MQKRLADGLQAVFYFSLDYSPKKPVFCMKA